VELSVRNLSVSYPGKTTPALQDVTLTIPSGTFCVIVGPSGCGKSTLLRCLAGIERPTHGEVSADGIAVSDPDPSRGMVFQRDVLFPWATVAANIQFALQARGTPKRDMESIVDELLTIVGLPLEVKKQRPAALSGGMRQRAGIARMLAGEPEVMLMDEPFAALDSLTRLRMQDLVADLWSRLGRTAVFVTHAALSACGVTGSSSKSLTVGFVVDPSWAQIPVAEAAGYFKSEGVNVKVVDFSTGVQALQALAAGQVDVTTSADVPVAASLAKATNMVVVADGSRWKGSVVVASAKAGIKSAADLAGKKVATTLGTSAAYFASSFLARASVTANLVQADPSEMVTAMEQGNVDAVSIFQPYQQQVISALGSNAVVLTPPSGTYIQQSLYLASKSAVKNKAAGLTDFMAALQKASTDLKEETPSSVSAVAAATQLPSPLVKTILSQFNYTVELPSTLPSELTALGQWAKSAGNLDKSIALPNYATYMDPAFLPKS
jgi:NitT/TauT family transport system substrate-binding protein